MSAAILWHSATASSLVWTHDKHHASGLRNLAVDTERETCVLEERARHEDLDPAGAEEVLQRQAHSILDYFHNDHRECCTKQDVRRQLMPQLGLTAPQAR